MTKIQLDSFRSVVSKGFGVSVVSSWWIFLLWDLCSLEVSVWEERLCVLGCVFVLYHAVGLTSGLTLF